MNKRVTIIAVLLILSAIILGAFGAHALKERLSAESLASFDVGVRYQMYMGIALLVLGTNAKRFKTGFRWSVNLILAGVLLFSLSIYLLALKDVLGVHMKFLGPVTPLGGSLMIIGWIVQVIHLFRTSNEELD